MKKVLAVLAAVISLTLIFSFTASAGDYIHRKSQNAAVILEDGKEIVYKGEYYSKVELNDVSFYSGVSVAYESLKTVFDDEKFESKFRSFEITHPADKNFVLFANCETKKGIYYSEVYVKTDYIDALNAFLNDESEVFYKTENYHGYLDVFSFSEEQIADWINPAGVMAIDAGDLDYDECYDMNIFDETGCFYKLSGYVLRKTNRSSADIYYYVSIEDGAFNVGEPGERIIAYRLDDEKLSEQLSVYYDTLPEDELDWLFDETTDIGALVLCSVFFAVLPLGVIILSIIMMAVYKDKYSRKGYIVMISASGVVIACFATLLILFKVHGIL